MLLVAVQTRPVAGGHVAAVHAQVGEALARGPLGEVRVVALAGDHQRRQQAQAGAAVLVEELRHDGVRGLRADGDVAVRAVLGAELDEEQPQEVVDLRHGGDRGLAPAAAGALLDGHGRGNAEDRVHVRARGGLDELAGVGVQGLQVAPLALVEEDVEGHGGLAGPRDPGNHRQPVVGHVHVDALEVMLPGVMDVDGVAPVGGCGDVRHRRCRGVGPAGPGAVAVGAQRRAGVAVRGGHDRGRRAVGDKLAAAVPAFGAEVDDPVGAADDVEVVLDDHQRVASLDQPLEGAQEHRDVVEVQPGGGLVEEEQQPLAAAAAAAVLRQVAGELEALGLAPGECGYRLAEAQVAEPDGGEGLQGPQDVRGVGEEVQGLGDGEVQHLGDGAGAVVVPRSRRQGDLQHLGAIAAAVAVRAAEVDVGEELHLDVLEAVAAARGAASAPGVEAEHPLGVAALARQRLGGEGLADGIEGTDVAGRVGARGAPDGGLIHEHHVVDVLPAVDASVGPGRIRGLALQFAQAVVEDAAHER
ncbi:hypothetical protein KBTX_02946 [wastewater metagenome]|uniref:Uncharacterized protein n=2 Tax=unclassified sequences TaxID=12908 RepID=A0A5B8RDD8_9ZZZZ|nr:hypothetical protein KBTEX_02946 [uncultured organism]